MVPAPPTTARIEILVPAAMLTDPDIVADLSLAFIVTLIPDATQASATMVPNSKVYVPTPVDAPAAALTM